MYEDDDRVNDPLSSIINLKSFSVQSDFLNRISKTPTLPLSETDLTNLFNNTDQLKKDCQDIISQLDESNNIRVVLELILNSYSLQVTKDIEVNNDLMSQLTQAQNDLDHQQEAIDSKLVQKISTSFNIPTVIDSDHLIDNLHDIVDENRGVIKNIIQNFDLPKETTTKDIVYQLTLKMQQANSSSITEQLRNQLLKTTEELEKIKNGQFPQDPSPQINEKEILSYFEDIPLENDEIQAITSQDLSFSEKLKQIASTLSLSIYSSEKVDDLKKKLLSIISSQFRFMKSLADSEKTYSTIYGNSEPYSEMRQTLLKEIETVYLFLQNHAIGIVEDSCLFEELLKKDTPNMLDNIKTYLENYTKPTCDESEDLFILLLQSISACDILRKYSSQSQELCHQQATSLKQMKNYSEQLEKSIDAINSTTTASIMFDKSPKKETTDMSNTSSIIDNDYVKNLKKQIKNLREENAQLRDSKEQLIRQAHTDLLKVQEQIDKIKETTNNKLIQKNRDIQKLSSALKESTERVKELRSENENLLKEKEKFSTSLLQTSKSHQDNFDVQKSDYENTISQLKDEIIEYQTKQTEVDQKVVDKDQEIQDLKDKLKQSSLNARKLAKRSLLLEEKMKEMNETMEKMSINENEAITQALLISQKYTEMHTDVEKLEDENKTLKVKLDSEKSSVKREKKIVESSYKQKLNEQRIKYETDIKVLKEENAQLIENKSLLFDIARMFPDYIDLNSTITRDSVNNALVKIKKIVEEQPDLLRKKKILDQISPQLNIKNENEILDEIHSLSNKYSQLLKEAKPLAHGMNAYLQLQGWLARLYIICTNGVCQNVSDAEMQHAVEETLMASYNNIILEKRIATLRAEKILLLSDKLKTPAKKEKLSLRHVLIMIMLVLKSRSLSGHANSELYELPPIEEADKEIPVKKNTAKIAPLNSFIYDLDNK